MILDELYKAGFTVAAVVSDLGPSNRKLWNTDFKTGIDERQKICPLRGHILIARFARSSLRSQV